MTKDVTIKDTGYGRGDEFLHVLYGREIVAVIDSTARTGTTEVRRLQWYSGLEIRQMAKVDECIARYIAARQVRKRLMK